MPGIDGKAIGYDKLPEELSKQFPNLSGPAVDFYVQRIKEAHKELWARAGTRFFGIPKVGFSAEDDGQTYTKVFGPDTHTIILNQFGNPVLAQ